MTESNQAAKKAPLKITCTSTDCASNKHCFTPDRRKKAVREALAEAAKQGAQYNYNCRACGVAPIDWKRIHSRDLQDFNYLRDSLNLELFRSTYWTKPFDEVAVDKFRRLNRPQLVEHALQVLDRSVRQPVRANTFNRDGMQTPLDRDVVFYAQHSLGCCCRKCMEVWYGIPRSFELTARDIGYFSDLVLRYIAIREVAGAMR